MFAKKILFLQHESVKERTSSNVYFIKCAIVFINNFGKYLNTKLSNSPELTFVVTGESLPADVFRIFNFSNQFNLIKFFTMLLRLLIQLKRNFSHNFSSLRSQKTQTSQWCGTHSGKKQHITFRNASQENFPNFLFSSSNFLLPFFFFSNCHSWMMMTKTSETTSHKIWLISLLLVVFFLRLTHKKI